MAADSRTNIGDKPSRPGLTDQQQRAIDARGVSVALSAGAGCGKTFVLTERFLAELEPDGTARPRLSQIVAITFTERAAREMRNRIRAACNRRLRECPENQVEYWLNLVRELDSARISTIHSFCGSLLRSHAVEAGVDPRFRVLDAAQAATLLYELTDDVLRGRLADRDETTLQLATRFSLNLLRKIIAEFLSRRQEIDWTAWRGETAEGLVARWENFWRVESLPRLLRRIGESADARTLLELGRSSPTEHPTMRQRFDVLLEQLPKLTVDATDTSPAELLAAIRDAAIVQGVTKKHWADEKAYEQFRDTAKSLRDAIDGVKKQLTFDAVAARPAAELALQALRLAADVAEQYDRRKRELGTLDFDDLLILARRLLVDEEQTGLRKRLASQIRLLLVDEFQDTDPLQVELVKSLCDNEHLRGKLFLVGDHKQSIYRFRGADPRVFRRLREEIPRDGRLPLSLNFRSQPAILNFVNALFAEELGPDYEPLRPHRPQMTPTPTVELLWANEVGRNHQEERGRVGEGESGRFVDATADPSILQVSKSPPLPLSPSASSLEDLGPRERLRRTEADWIARRIRNMLDAGEKIVWDKEATKAGMSAVRAARPGDIALLFRAMTNVEYYEEALQRYGIDYYLVGGRAFYAQQEIYDLLNLLRTLNSSCDAVSLAGVLRSPMFGLLDETLFWLSRNSDGPRQPDGLSAGLFSEKLPEEIDDAQRERVAFAAAAIRELRALKDRLSVAGLIQESLRRTSYDAMLLAEFLGERKLANLHKLIEQARSFDRAGVFTLSDFITQLSEFVARQPDEALAATQPESTDVVKLMSIHQSKGLEFPVVIVPDVARPRRLMPPPAAFSPELGPAFKDDSAVTGYDLLMAIENEEDRREHSRLLYVATTRAADYLILSAGVEKLGDAKGPWMELLASRFDLVSGANKTVRVTADRPEIKSKPMDLRSRRDLMKMLDKARDMAEKGQGRRLRYLEPVPCDESARRQYSFSRLNGTLHARANAGNVGASEDGVSANPPIDARGLGTLVHAVLEEFDFSRLEDVRERVQRLAEQHLPESEQRLEEPTEMIERFLASPRAKQMAASPEMYRELEFLLAWPPGENQSNGRYLQGFIDCLYRDIDGGWQLIDYKTNQATAETLAARAASYEMQMLVYALATETILKTPPVELTLCFLRPGLEYHFAWDAAARRRVVELVNGALP